MNRKDMCKCGHPRQLHNNRIIKPYYPDLKYNCCMAGNCDCNKFTLDEVQE